MVHHELVLPAAPVTFEEAVTRAQEEAPKRSVERIHVKHARRSSKPAAIAKAPRSAGTRMSQSKKRAPAGRKPVKLGGGRSKRPA